MIHRGLFQPQPFCDSVKLLGVPMLYTFVMRPGKVPREQPMVCGEDIPVSELCEQ